jgi:hypothetical protein
MMKFSKHSFTVTLLISLSIGRTLFHFRDYTGSSLQDYGVSQRREADEGPTRNDFRATKSDSPNPYNAIDTAVGKCAINLFGLPRAFESLVLPSLVQNVIGPNALYNCDFFVHYFYLTHEQAGRSGSGGRINPDEVLLLKEAVHAVSPDSVVEIRYDHEQHFWDQYQAFLDKVRTTNGTDGHYLYYPWRATTFEYPQTMDNIIKMWHSVQSAWETMTEQEGVTSERYDRVAMLRLDVLYVTPIDVFRVHRQPLPERTKVAVVPAFARFPVNDRMIVGPRDAVEIWAAQRFERLETHVQLVQTKDPGWGIHDERFMSWTVFPAIRATNTTIVEDNFICFFRARADETVQISDCQNGDQNAAARSIVKSLGKNRVKLVESILGRKCLNRTIHARSKISLSCPKTL